MSVIDLFYKHYPECDGTDPQRLQNFLNQVVSGMFTTNPVRKGIFDVIIPFTFKVQDIGTRRALVKSILTQRYGNYPSFDSSPITVNPIPDLTLISTSNILSDLFILYDHYFSGGTFSAYAAGTKITMEFSDLLTSTGGKCGFRGNSTYVLRISSKILRDIHPNSGKTLTAGGLPVEDRLDGLMLIFEHELIHLVIQVSKEIDTSSHGTLFRQMIKGMFGQTSMSHGLTERSGQDRRDIQVGQVVYFNLKKKEVSGIVHKLNSKTVQVHTEHGDFRVEYRGLRL